MYKAPLTERQFVRYSTEWGPDHRFYNADTAYWGSLENATKYSATDPIQYALGRYEAFVSLRDAKRLVDGDEVLRHLY